MTPAWQRFELTAVCLEQRKRAIAVLAEHGIEGRCVVIADDANLDIARDKGFDVVERDNQWLGRRFNDGYAYAGDHGATWIVPIGSDSWIDPAYFLPMPDEGRIDRVRSSHLYAAVESTRMATCNVAMERCPAGPYVFHRDLLARAGFRPTKEELNKNLDSSTIFTLQPFRWEHRDDHELQYIGFRHPVHIITRYANLWTRWGVAEYTDPWDRLAEVYDRDLVEAARKAIS